MDSPSKTSLAEKIASPIRVGGIIIRESLRSFLNNNDFEMSAALATYSFFAIVPLLFFVANITGGNSSLTAVLIPGIEGLIDHLFPRIRDWMSIELSTITKHRFTMGAVIIVFVFIAAMSLMDSLRTAFLKIFRKEPPASFVVSQFKNARAALIMLILFVILVLAEAVYSGVPDILPPGHFFLTKSGDALISVCVATICMIVFYAVFLPVKLTPVKLVSASIISAVLIVFMREVFAFLIKTRPGYGETFGSLKTLFVMIVWVYYCFLVILFGAEVAVNTEKRNALLLKNLFAGQFEQPSSKTLLKRFTTSYMEGDDIFREGDGGDNMFYIAAGCVDISRGGKTIRTMTRGEYFGEISMLLGTPRSASASAAAPDTELIVISQGNFDIILRENAPIVLAVLKEMADRLKDTDESLFKYQTPG